MIIKIINVNKGKNQYILRLTGIYLGIKYHERFTIRNRLFICTKVVNKTGKFPCEIAQHKTPSLVGCEQMRI